MTISFNEVLASFRTFGVHVEVDSSRAVATPPTLPHRILVVAPQLKTIHSEGDVIQVTNKAFATAEFGIGSIAEQMVFAIFDTAPNVEVWVAPVDDEGGGTQATGDFTFSGTATEAGEIALYVAGHRIAVAVASGDDAATIETKAVAAIQAVEHKLPATVAAGAPGTSADLTARHKGTFGNQIDLRHSYHPGEKVPAGLTVTANAMSGGATDPAITDALSLLGPNDVWQSIPHPWTDATNLASVEAEIATRWNAMDQRRGVAFTALGSRQGDGSAATHSSQQTLTDARNSAHQVILTGLEPTAPWVKAAAAAAVDASHSDPAVPRRGSALRGPGMLPPAPSAQFTRTERDSLLGKGGATTVVEGGQVVIEWLISTYQTKGGVPDTSFLSINTSRITEKISADISNRFRLKYRKAKLAADDVEIAGQTILTPNGAIAEILDLSEDWLAAGLVQRLPDPSKGEVVADIDSAAGRLNIQFNPHYMLQFRGMGVLNQFLLTE